MEEIAASARSSKRVVAALDGRPPARARRRPQPRRRLRLRRRRPPADEKQIGLIWIDAHGDMNTPATTLQAATSTACRSRRCSAGARRALADRRLSPKVRPDHTVLIGIRDLDEREMAAVLESGVHVFTIKEIDRHGIAAIVEQAIAQAGGGTAGLHVSFDLDVCARVSRPASARRSRAGSTTARPTCRWRSSPIPAAPRAGHGRGQPGPRHSERHRRPRRGARPVGVRTGHSLSVGCHFIREDRDMFDSIDDGLALPRSRWPPPRRPRRRS